MTIVPAKNGYLWLARGFALFRRSPARWLMVVLGYWITIALFNQVPVAGVLMATILLPAFSVSFMIMCERVERGEAIGITALFAGFRSQLAALIRMGALYLGAILLVLAIASVVDNGTLWRWVVGGQSPSPAALEGSGLSLALTLAALLGTPVMMAFWFAPVLTAWQGMGVGKALFFSFFAAWHNWRAFLVYGAVMMLIGIGMSAAIGLVGLLSSARVVPVELMRFGALLLSMALLPIMFGSFYASYRDLFPPRQATPEITDADRLNAP